ncbi:MAG: hypothetical protein IKO40_09710, partial [Kiritimatiellae bacterium]|nr:hypothetical protein [Kiritimatiellia bacterium]
MSKVAVFAITALLPAVIFARRGEFVKIEQEPESNKNPTANAIQDSVSEDTVTYQEVGFQAEETQGNVEERIKATKESILGKPQKENNMQEPVVSGGRGELVRINKCNFCQVVLNADGTCSNAANHRRCSKCKSELNADGTCPNAANHRRCSKCKSELNADGTCPKAWTHLPIIPILSVLLAVVVVAWLFNRKKPPLIPPEWIPGPDWRSPPGIPDILYSPPLAASAGGNGGFSEICRARRKSGEKLENGLYMLK